MTYEIQCAECGAQFESTRADAGLCSSKGRVGAHRAIKASLFDATLINEVVDIHDRAYRLWLQANPEGDLIAAKFTTTFSSAVKPEAHRTVWQTSLPLRLP